MRQSAASADIRVTAASGYRTRDVRASAATADVAHSATTASCSDTTAAAASCSDAAASTAAAASVSGVNHNHGRNSKSYDSGSDMLEREHWILLLNVRPRGPLRADVRIWMSSFSGYAPMRRGQSFSARKAQIDPTAVPPSAHQGKVLIGTGIIPAFPYTIAVESELALGTYSNRIPRKGRLESTVGTFGGIRTAPVAQSR